MHIRSRLERLTALAILGLASTSVSAQTAPAGAAQNYPNKLVRIILPYAAGGASDTLARALAQKLTESLGQAVIVDNRAGANGVVGTDAVAKAAPDGYTLLWTVSTHTILPGLVAKLPYDSEADFAPVTQLTSQSFVMGVYPGLPVKTVGELIALAKSKPGALNYASGSTGNVTHIGVELLKSMTGINMLHIPYKGGAPATLALMSGEVSLLLSSMSTTVPHVQSGKIRAIAVTGAQRSVALPNVPTVMESGVPDYEVSSWYGIMTTARTPAAIITRLHSEIGKAMLSPDMKARVLADGSDIVISTPDAFGKHLKNEIIKWTKVIKMSGARLE